MAAGNKRFADDGWAVWIDGNDTSTVYLNDWMSPHGNSFIDFGIHIRGARETHALNLYIPFPVEKSDVEDVSLKLDDEAILRAIFSSACIIDFKKNECTSEVAYRGRTLDLVHLSLCGFALSPLAEGALLTVDLDKLQPFLANDEAYLLFRLPHRSLDEIFRPRVNVGSLLVRLRDLIMSPVISEKYGYSVRINEARLLPAEINRIGAFHMQKLQKAVVTVSINEDYEPNDGNCYRIRRLEADLYKSYVPDGFDCEDAITYQWNQSRDANLLGHFNFYFTIFHSEISRMSMFVYMVLLMLIGIAGGALWDWIKYALGL